MESISAACFQSNIADLQRQLEFEREKVASLKLELEVAKKKAEDAERAVADARDKMADFGLI